MSLEPLHGDRKSLRKSSRQRKKARRHGHLAARRGGQFGRVEQLEYRLLLSGSLVVTTPPPSSITAGQSFTMVVTAENADGSVNTSFNGSVSVADSGYTLLGALSVNASHGVASFLGLTPDTAAVQRLSAASSGLPTVYTSYFTVTAAPATKLAIAGPSNVLLNRPFGLFVDAEDQFSNIDTTYNGSVTTALAANPGFATLGGTLTAPAVNAVVSFSGLTINKPGSGYKLRATASGLVTAASEAFDVAENLVVTTQPPSTITAGSPFGVVVAVEDGNGNIDNSFSGSVTVADANGYSMGGMLTVNAVNGVATFSGLTQDSARYHNLAASASGLATVSMNGMTVTAAPAASLLIRSPGDSLVNGTFSVVVATDDIFGNSSSTFNGSVTLALDANPGGATLQGTLTVQAVAGVATFSGLAINNAGNGYTLQATSTGLTPGISAPFNETDQLVVTKQPPTSVTAGVPFGLALAAENALGNIDTSFSGSVTVSNFYGSLIGPQTVQMVNGVASFSGLTLDTAGPEYISATWSANPMVNTNNFTVIAGAPAKLSAATPSGILANGPFSYQVGAVDAFGNSSSTFNGIVTLALLSSNGTLGGTLTVQAINGVAAFSGLTIGPTGANYALQATSAGLTSAITYFSVTDKLAVTTQPPANITAGAPFGLVVTLEDGLGNTDTSFTGSVKVSDVGGSTLGGTSTVNAVNGVLNFSGLTETTPGSSNLYLTSSGLYSLYTNEITVTAAPATKLAVAAPSHLLANGSFNFAVDAEDPFGNIDSTFSGSVTLALAANPGNATLGGTLTVQAVSGIATFSGLTISTTGSGYILQATSTGLTAGTTATFNVTDKLVVTTQPPPIITAGVPFGLVVTAEDAQGNADTSFSGSLTLADSGGDALGGTLALNAVNGVATFSGLTETVPGSRYLVVTSSNLSATDTSTFSVVPVPTVISVTPEDNAGNGVAAGSAAKGQRSMETQIAVVFTEPVSLASGAFSLGLVNNYGSGTNDGSPDTALSGVLGTPANPSGDGETWIIPILSNGTNSYALKATQGGISGASLDNGVYQLNVVASDVTAASSGTAMTANYTSAAWHRLFGDVDNARRVFNAEYSSFLAAFNSTYVSNGATNYNQDLDNDGDGRVFNTDYAAFLADFGSTKIYTEPQS